MGKQIGNVNTENAFLVRARRDIVEPRFLGFALENTINQGGLDRVAQGSVQKSINKDDLEDLELEVNPALMGMEIKPTVDEVAEVKLARNVKQFKKGDILVSNRGTVGRTEFIDEDIEAKFGFMGMIKSPRTLRVGEQNKREFVSIKPKNNFNFFATKKSKKKNNIFDVGGF